MEVNLVVWQNLCNIIQVVTIIYLYAIVTDSVSWAKVVLITLFICPRSTYKPPLLIPAIPTTEKSTTLSILENEIDQVVLKVAQSVDSIKAVTTETTVEKEVEDGEEQMLADSPEVEEVDDNSSEEEEIEESEEERQPPSSSENDSSSEVTESSSSEEDSSEESSDYNTESAENVVQQHYGSETMLTEEEALLKVDSNPELKVNATGQEPVFSQTESFSEQFDDKSSNFITIEENPLKPVLLKDTHLQNEIFHDIISKDSSDEDTSEDSVDPDEGLASNQVTPKTQLSKDPESVNIGDSSVPKPPTSANTMNDKLVPNSSSTTKSEVTPLLTNMKGEVSNMQVVGGNKTDDTGVAKDTTTPSNPPQSTTEDRLGTTTTVSPGSDNGQVPPMGEVTQGQPKPCSRNCSEQVMFEFQNQPLCFGSMFTVDWIVTSASCALR